MTPEERQALREKHTLKVTTYPQMVIGRSLAPSCTNNECVVCGFGQPYPCDVIKVLDELEMWIKE